MIACRVLIGIALAEQPEAREIQKSINGLLSYLEKKSASPPYPGRGCAVLVKERHLQKSDWSGMWHYCADAYFFTQPSTRTDTSLTDIAVISENIAHNIRSTVFPQKVFGKVQIKLDELHDITDLTAAMTAATTTAATVIARDMRVHKSLCFNAKTFMEFAATAVAARAKGRIPCAMKKDNRKAFCHYVVLSVSNPSYLDQEHLKKVLRDFLNSAIIPHANNILVVKSQSQKDGTIELCFEIAATFHFRKYVTKLQVNAAKVWNSNDSSKTHVERLNLSTYERLSGNDENSDPNIHFKNILLRDCNDNSVRVLLQQDAYPEMIPPATFEAISTSNLHQSQVHTFY